MIFELILGLSFWTNDVEKLEMARQLSQQNSCMDSNFLLKTVNPNNVDRSTYYFLKLFNEYRMNDREEALKTAQFFDFFVDDMPLRYQHLAYLMINDLKQWEKDDLEDISRDMKHVQDRLGDAKGGEKTREVQKEIVRKLDKNIKEIENKIKQSQSQQQQGQKGEDKPNEPMPDSAPGGVSGPGKVDPKEHSDKSKEWGRMPEKERTKAMMRKVQEMPVKQRQMIEDYFKKVASESGKK